MVHPRHDGQIHADGMEVHRIPGSDQEDVELVLDSRVEEGLDPPDVVGDLN